MLTDHLSQSHNAQSIDADVFDRGLWLAAWHKPAAGQRTHGKVHTVPNPEPEPEPEESTPNVAWRTIDVPNAGVAMLHQRSRTDEIQVSAGGYGSSNCGAGIVQSSVTSGLDRQVSATGDLLDMTLAVDVAADQEGKLLAVVSPDNHGGASQFCSAPSRCTGTAT
jgi:hypothetical protein